MDGFAHFLAQRKADLAQLARATRGEHSHADVCQQAWLEARELAGEQGRAPDFLDAEFQRQVIHRLYRKLYHAGRGFRSGARLDHGFGDDDGHPLARRLVSDEGRDPLSGLMDAEATAAEPPDEDRLPLSLALALKDATRLVDALAVALEVDVDVPVWLEVELELALGELLALGARELVTVAVGVGLVADTQMKSCE